MKLLLFPLYYFSVIRYYVLDMIRYVRYSGIFHKKNTEIKFISDIIMSYHVLEKGLTMPDMRLGFGVERVNALIDLCNEYMSRGYEKSNCQFLHAIGVIDEYRRTHQASKFEMNTELLDNIDKLIQKVGSVPCLNQIGYTKESYFKENDSTFEYFSASRHSLRNFTSEEIDIEILKKAILLAQNAPSSCNRQQARVYVIQDKEKIKQVLNCQNGHRGFGHLSNKLIILTASVEEYSGIGERNSAYIDGGLFGMNLLYCLHYYKVGVCTLNAYFSYKTEKRMRQICDVPPSEVFLMVLACGKVPEQFKVTLSKRNDISKILHIV